MVAPLDDITVVEVDNWMAAPSAAAILADMGAKVIKVEPLSGDPMRGKNRPAKIEGALGDYDLQFDVDNRGKQSIAIALDQEEGIKIVHELVSKAQLFLCNLLPARQQKFGLDAETLFAINSKLVHATLTGYGTGGPDAWRPGYDVTAFFGRSGLYDAKREGEQGEVPMARPAQGDHTTGLALVGAVLAALRLVDRTGQPQVVETSLYETAVWTQASDFAVTAVDKAHVRRRARHQMLLPTANRYPCGDGKWVVFNMPEASAWPKLCRIIGREDWIEDERLKDASSRYRNMEELVSGIDVALATKSRDEWGEIFDREGIIWGPVLTLDEAAVDAQAHAINLFPEIVDEKLGTYRSVSIPMRFHNADVGPQGSAPDIGEHTGRILTELGYASADVDRLVEAGVIGIPDPE